MKYYERDFAEPVDGDGGADSKIGNNHYTGVEEDKGLRCNLRIKIILIVT